jgi:REP element-mobilizing transposase RayT
VHDDTRRTSLFPTGTTLPKDDSFALLLTWTCYGNWLPGDARGYVSNTHLASGGWLPKENVPGTPYTKDDPLTRHQTRTLMNEPPARLSAEEALCAAEALVEAARKRGWRILRAALMANHVHVVICDCPDNGPRVRRILKGTSQAKLSDKAGINKSWWTNGGSDRYLHGDNSILAAIKYVAEQEYKLVEIIDMQVVVPERTP